MTTFVSFYSFKGGVGRTSALMNVARHLARMKKKVLIVDADIAAPGVDVFEILDPAMIDYPSYNPLRRLIYHRSEAFDVAAEFKKMADERKDKNERQFAAVDWTDLLQKIQGSEKKKVDPGTQQTPRGLVELLLHLAERLIRGSDQRKLPDIDLNRRYNDRELDGGSSEIPYVFSIAPKTVAEAELRVIRAGAYDGKEALDYPRKMDALISLLQRGTFEPEEAARGGSSVGPEADNKQTNGTSQAEKFRAQLAAQFRLVIETQLMPEYVLIDCRPGVDVISEFAYADLSYTNVLCFNLNPWNLHGVIKVYERLQEIRAAQLDENDSRRPLDVLLVATPVPRYAQNSILYAKQFTTVRDTMKGARNNGAGEEGSVVEVPFSDVLLLRDVLIDDVEPYDAANAKYGDLARLIVQTNPSDVVNAIARIKRATIDNSIRVDQLATLEREYPVNPAVAMELAQLHFDMGNHKQTLECLERAAKADRLPLGALAEKDQPNEWPAGYSSEIRIKASRALVAWLGKEPHGSPWEWLVDPIRDDLFELLRAVYSGRRPGGKTPISLPVAGKVPSKPDLEAFLEVLYSFRHQLGAEEMHAVPFVKFHDPGWLEWEKEVGRGANRDVEPAAVFKRSEAELCYALGHLLRVEAQLKSRSAIDDQKPDPQAERKALGAAYFTALAVILSERVMEYLIELSLAEDALRAVRLDRGEPPE